MAVTRWILLGALLAAGCQPLQLVDEPKTATVSSNPFGLQAETQTTKAQYQPADEAVAARVDATGRKLLAANPELGLKTTLFATIGNAPQPEVFHVGPNMVYVTDGLLRRCTSEAELAALLAVELGKIISEREAAASPDMRQPERPPPIQVAIGNATHDTNPDLVQQVELARYEKERSKKRRALPRLDPQELARGYLDKAGFQPAALDTAQPLLQACLNNATLERQFKGAIGANTWTP